MEQVAIVWVLIGALAGVIAGGGTVAVVLQRANRSKELKDTTEELLAKAVPMSALEIVSATANRAIDLAERYGEQVRQTVIEGATFIRDVTDGQPNEPAPEAASPAIGGAAHG